MSDTEDDFDDLDLPDREAEAAEQDNDDADERERLDQANEALDSYSNGSDLGHVIASRDLRVSRLENDIWVYVHSEHRDDVRLGDYVQLPYPATASDEHAELFGIIEELQYAHRNEVNDQEDFRGGTNENGGIEERRYTLVARVNPITIIEGEEDDLDSGQVDRIPKPSTYMYPSDNENCLRTGLNIPAHGPFVGYMSVSGETRPRENPLPYKLPDDDDGGEPAIFRHGVVGGSTGKGKTHFMKNVIRQYASPDREYTIELSNENDGDAGSIDSETRKKLGMVIIDPENEYSELGEDNPEHDYDEPKEALNGESINDLQRKGIEVGGINDQPGQEDLRTYVPDVKWTSMPNVKNSHTFSIPFSIVQGRPQLLMPFEAEGPTRDALEKCISEFFDQKDPDAQTYSRFVDFVERSQEWAAAGDIETATEMGLPPGGKWALNQNLNENSLEAVYRRIDRSEFEAVFDNGAEPITDLTNEMFRPGRTTVIPTNHLTGNKEKLVVMSVLAVVVDNKLYDYNPDYNIKDTPLLLVLDEAHNYISEPSTTQEEYVVRQYRLAARQGRKYKLGLFNVTQNPADIDEEILKQTNTSIYLGLEPEVIEEINIPGNYENALPTFGKGQAVVKAPDVRAVEVMGLSVCLTKHSK